MADVGARLMGFHRAGQRLPLAQAAYGKDGGKRASVVAHRVRVENHRNGDFRNAAAHRVQPRMQLRFLTGDGVRGPAAAGVQRFAGNHQRAAELRGDALLRAAEIIFIAADDFAAAQIHVLANAADAVVPLGGDGHQRFFRETGAELHVAVQKQQIFAASFFRADKASQPGGRLSFGEQKTARAQGLCRLQALIRRAGIHIDDLVSQYIESGLDALQAGGKPLSLVFADDNDADQRSFLPCDNML